MPIATTLPASAVTLRFPRYIEGEEESYQLLELPAEILKQVEGKTDPLSLTIRGRPSDDAVLCTPTGTYTLRSVSVSNSLMVCRAPKGDTTRPELEIRDTSHEIMELVPQAPNVERIRSVLRPSAWKGLGHALIGDPSARKRKRGDVQEEGGNVRQYTLDQMRSVIQASEAELEKALKERNVVEINGRLIMLPPTALGPLLTIILNLLTIHATSSSAKVSTGIASSPSRPILRALHDDHEVESELASAVMKHFAADSISADPSKPTKTDTDDLDVEWTANTKSMVKVVGMSELEKLREPIPLDRFESRWAEAVGEWSELVDLAMLEGNYLLNTPSPSAFASPSPDISYFPAHLLPVAPAVRFADLFLTRTPWRPDDMDPFLRAMYRPGDTKERDKLVAKFVRVVKDKSGVWWYSRRSS